MEKINNNTMANEMTESATNMYKMDGPDMNE